MNDARDRATDPRTIEPAMLEVTSVRVEAGLWIGGCRAAVPDEVTVVVTLEQAATPVTGAGVTEVREPFLDSRWQPVDHARVTAAFQAVMRASDTGVLIRCRHGLNRSALIAVLVLVARGWPTDDAVEAVRRARPGALSNPYFADLVETWPEDPMGDRR